METAVIEKYILTTKSAEGLKKYIITQNSGFSEKYISVQDLTPKTFTKQDGASLLANLLFEEASHIKFFVGQSVNVAHQGLPIDTTMKLKLVEKLASNLRAMGKTVMLNYD